VPLVALRGGRVAGFLLGSPRPAADYVGPDRSAGVVNLLLFDPAERELGDALVQRGLAEFRAFGAESAEAMSASGGYPFLRGLYCGSEPALPEGHRRAISRLGFGLLDKTFLSYPSAWWGEGLTQIATAGFGVGKAISAFDLGPVTDRAILCGFTGAGFARALEGGAGGGAKVVVSRRLRDGFGVQADPAAALATGWAADRFTRGSYSFLAVGSTSRDRAVLAAPAGRLIVAGEHTSTERPATMDGALVAGRRAANRLLARLG